MAMYFNVLVYHGLQVTFMSSNVKLYMHTVWGYMKVVCSMNQIELLILVRNFLKGHMSLRFPYVCTLVGGRGVDC